MKLNQYTQVRPFKAVDTTARKKVVAPGSLAKESAAVKMLRQTNSKTFAVVTRYGVVTASAN